MVANLYVSNVPIGQPLCPNLDRLCVLESRKSVFLGGGRDNLYVIYHSWCSTQFLSFSTNFLARIYKLVVTELGLCVVMAYGQKSQPNVLFFENLVLTAV